LTRPIEKERELLEKLTGNPEVLENLLELAGKDTAKHIK
jgi:hypothetical protein